MARRAYSPAAARVPMKLKAASVMLCSPSFDTTTCVMGLSRKVRLIALPQPGVCFPQVTAPVRAHHQSSRAVGEYAFFSHPKLAQGLLASSPWHHTLTRRNTRVERGASARKSAAASGQPRRSPGRCRQRCHRRFAEWRGRKHRRNLVCSKRVSQAVASPAKRRKCHVSLRPVPRHTARAQTSVTRQFRQFITAQPGEKAFTPFSLCNHRRHGPSLIFAFAA